MNVKSLSDATLLAVWRALDSEVRKRKVKNTMPVGTFTVDADSLVIPAGTIERKEAFRAPTIHASPLAMAAFIGQKSGCVGPALQGLIVDGLSVAAKGDLHHSIALAGVNEAEIGEIKKAIAADCPKVSMIRTTVKWK
jgi:hypothetical protein